MEEGKLGKIIKTIFGIALICYLTYIGLGILLKGGETVVNRMEDRATKSRDEAKDKDCEIAKINYQKLPSEKNRSTAEAACERM